MSGALLQYPKKPNELSDDLESFIHIICWNTFRFHMHSLSRVDMDNKEIASDNKALRKANSMNTRLAGKVYNYFHAEFTDEDQSVGGDGKISFLTAGTSPVEPLSTNSPLASLISGLFVLCKEHYASVRAELKTFAPVRGLPHTRRTKKSAYNPLDGLAKGKMPVLVAPTGPAVAQRDLKSHDHMLEELNLVLSDDVEWEADDKTPDQFVGLVDFPPVRAKGESGGSGSKHSRSEGNADRSDAKKKRVVTGPVQLQTVDE